MRKLLLTKRRENAMADFNYTVKTNTSIFGKKSYTYTIKANGAEFTVTSKKQMSDAEIKAKIKYNNEKSENQFVFCDLDDSTISVKDFGGAKFELDKNSDGNKLEIKGDSNDEVTVLGKKNTIKTGKGNDKVNVYGANNTVETGDGKDTVTIAGSENKVKTGKGEDTITVQIGSQNSVDGGEGKDKIHIKNDASDTKINAKGSTADTIIDDGKNSNVKKDKNDTIVNFSDDRLDTYKGVLRNEKSEEISTVEKYKGFSVPKLTESQYRDELKKLGVNLAGAEFKYDSNGSYFVIKKDGVTTYYKIATIDASKNGGVPQSILICTEDSSSGRKTVVQSFSDVQKNGVANNPVNLRRRK